MKRNGFERLGKFFALMVTVFGVGSLFNKTIVFADEQTYDQVPSLKEIYKDDFLIGNIYNDDYRLPGIQQNILKKHFNALTAENLMKVDHLQREKGKFTFEAADNMVDFDQKNGFETIGHTLVWHAQIPKFMEEQMTRDIAIQELKTHIQTVASRYKGKIKYWDVLNEALDGGIKLGSDGDWTKGLRKESPWYKNIGPDYVKMAFEFAHEAAPEAILYYNDFNLNDQDKVDFAVAMYKDLKKQNVPIDGIGMQAHYNINTAIGGVRMSVEKIIASGAKLSITELDVGVPGVSKNELTKEQEIKQAQVYAQLFNIYKEKNKYIERVTFWGFLDETGWRKEDHPNLFRNVDKAIVKEAYYAVANPSAYLEKHPLNLIPTPRRMSSVYTEKKPGLTAELTDTWKGISGEKINQFMDAHNGATAVVRSMWDNENMYFFVEVKDSVLSDLSANPWEQDSVEIFLDENNGKTEVYEEDDNQYRINYKNVVTYGKGGERAGFESSTKIVEGGYNVEVKIPLKKNNQQKLSAKEMVVGVDFQINDSNEKGVRYSVAKFNDPTDNSWSSTLRWGEMVLLEDTKLIDTKPTDTKPTDTKPTNTSGKNTKESDDLGLSGSSSSATNEPKSRTKNGGKVETKPSSTDNRKEKNLPKTGIKEGYITCVAGIFLVVLGVSLVLYKKNSSK